jgi:hypothetical protein
MIKKKFKLITSGLAREFAVQTRKANGVCAVRGEVKSSVFSEDFFYFKRSEKYELRA